MTDDKELKTWLRRDQTDLVKAVAREIGEHVASLKAERIRFYGYALNPGVLSDISSIVSIYNCPSDIKVEPDDEEYDQFKYAVDEWEHWYHDGFPETNELLRAANEQFSVLHKKDTDDFMMDEFQLEHSNSLLLSILSGFESCQKSGSFDNGERPFLAIWFSDTPMLVDDPDDIVCKSIKRLNTKSVADKVLDLFAE
jgi:hypothetical protein